MSDFLSWDQDIDLDLLLGEYTELYPDPSDSDEECYNAKKKSFTVSLSCLSNIANDPFTINESIVDICKFVTNSALVQDILLKYFQHIFVVLTSNISSSSDREQMYRRLHISRVNPELTKTVGSHCPSHSLKSINLFLQMVHADIVDEIVKVQTMTAVHKSTTEQEKLTENDKSILYNIAGYTIRALQKRYTRYFAKKVWYKTQDRGDLQKSSDSLFLLTRELETVVRKTVQPSYSARSLLIAPLKEAMMEAFMMKHYCDILMQGETADIVSALTEDIIHLFLTIRGFAVTRIERNKLTKKAKTHPHPV
ncbi:unnamed protein product [Mytilus coruscus]|uniref:Uncharacterized protein n=1 Tax=Mytilus coruscus TaxID=42192 RepID=A0A6J7ZVC6_MYTCO|nr:unnamed protein product [Mytilus coruscus]